MPEPNTNRNPQRDQQHRGPQSDEAAAVVDDGGREREGRNFGDTRESDQLAEELNELGDDNIEKDFGDSQR